jgi:acyl dehydratase
VEEAEHQIATRLYQNTAKVHFNQHAQAQTPRGKRLIYGGVAISLARSLAFNGLANAAEIIAINAGQHVNPLFAGDTVFAWSEVLDKVDLGDGLGALRLRLVATKNRRARISRTRMPRASTSPTSSSISIIGRLYPIAGRPPYIGPMYPPALAKLAAALAIILSVVIRSIRGGASWQQVDEGRATADVRCAT